MVPVLHRLTKREDSSEGADVKLKTFQKDLKLYLTPPEGNLANIDTPVWTVESDPQALEGMLYKQIPGVCLNFAKYLYHYLYKCIYIYMSSSILVYININIKIYGYKCIYLYIYLYIYIYIHIYEARHETHWSNNLCSCRL